MSHVHRHVQRLVLSVGLAVALVPAAAAADPGRDHASRARDLHWQNEDRLYAKEQAAADARKQARLIALHFRHEEAVERSRRSASSAPSPAVAGRLDSVARSYAVGALLALVAGALAATLAVRRRERLA